MFDPVECRDGGSVDVDGLPLLVVDLLPLAWRSDVDGARTGDLTLTGPDQGVFVDSDDGTAVQLSRGGEAGCTAWPRD